MLSSDSMIKYLSYYLKLGFEQTHSSNDYFAKAAGAWSMMEYHLKNTNKSDSLLFYRKISYNCINNIPVERQALKNFAIMMTELFTFRFYSKFNDKFSRNLTNESLINLKNVIENKIKLRLINFDEMPNCELVNFYHYHIDLDSGISILKYYYNDYVKNSNLIYANFMYCELFSRLYYKLGDYKHAFEFEKESNNLKNKFIDRNESIQRIARLRELEEKNYQNKLKAEETQQQLTFIIMILIALSAGIIIFIIINRYKKIQSLNSKLDEANNTKSKLF